MIFVVANIHQSSRRKTYLCNKAILQEKPKVGLYMALLTNLIRNDVITLCDEKNTLTGYS